MYINTCVCVNVKLPMYSYVYLYNLKRAAATATFVVCIAKEFKGLRFRCGHFGREYYGEWN